MTIIQILRDPVTRRISGFDAQGHSGFAEHGEDLVCAGISALTLTALLGIEQIANLRDFFTHDEQKALIHCRIPRDVSAEKAKIAGVILETMRLGLIEIAREYPKFLRLIDEGGANLDPF